MTEQPLRIQVADPIDPAGLKILEEEAEVVQEDSLEALDQYDALIVRGATKVAEGDIRRAQPRLKVIGRAGVGVDNIDLMAAKAHQVTVVNAPLAASNAVAELALGLMFSLARHTTPADAAMKRGEWIKKELGGTELAGKTLGILGVGRIGAALAAKARALGMEIIGHDPPLSEQEIKARGARPVPLPELLAQSDYVSLHVPLTENTAGLIGSDELKQLKRGARIVCAARGGVLDEEALLTALEDGWIAGAALDVFEEEPPGATPLVRHPNVIATPHLGAQTKEAQVRASLNIAEEVLAALAGEELRWQVA